MYTASFARRLRQSVTINAIALELGAGLAAAQTTTGSIRGFITTSDGAPAVGPTVTATNVANGAQRSNIATDRGFFVLTSLVPSQYDVAIRRVGLQPQPRRQTVGIGQVFQLDLMLGSVAARLGTVTVAATRAVHTRTSEVATNVTQAQIDALPTSDRDILGLASFTPGVRISGAGAEGTTRTFRAGALDAGSINVFIDGASPRTTSPAPASFTRTPAAVTRFRRMPFAHDRWPTRDFSSVASIGFALTAYPIGVERRWITRK